MPRSEALTMKPLTLGLVVALGLFGNGCSSEAADESPPAPSEVVRVASSLERRLPAPLAVPGDTPIGGSIDALVEARQTLVARDPIVNLGASGKRCTIIRFDDDNGAEVMRREQCEGAVTLRVGKLLYTDQNGDGKIDQFSDTSDAGYDLFDDDRDGKLDRMVESAARITTPISLADFGASVTITSGGTIASRAREDKDHDGRFDVESVTATTSFQIRTIVTSTSDQAR